MTEMFRYLTGILEKDEQRIWKILTVVCFFNSLENIFNICYGSFVVGREVRISV